MTNNFVFVTCKDCGWVHKQVSMKYVQNWKKEWDEFWPTLNEEGKESYGLQKGPPSISTYLHCFFCSGSYKNFRDALDDDCPIGCTIQPILGRNE